MRGGGPFAGRDRPGAEGVNVTQMRQHNQQFPSARRQRVRPAPARERAGSSVTTHACQILNREGPSRCSTGGGMSAPTFPAHPTAHRGRTRTCHIERGSSHLDSRSSPSALLWANLSKCRWLEFKAWSPCERSGELDRVSCTSSDSHSIPRDSSFPELNTAAAAHLHGEQQAPGLTVHGHHGLGELLSRLSRGGRVVLDWHGGAALHFHLHELRAERCQGQGHGNVKPLCVINSRGCCGIKCAMCGVLAIGCWLNLFLCQHLNRAMRGCSS